MEKILPKKIIFLMIIIFFIGLIFSSASAIKSDISEIKIEPFFSPLFRDVYYDCYIITDEGSAPGIAILSPGFFRSIIFGHTTITSNASGVVLNIHPGIDDFPISIDGNSYYNKDWDLMIVSNYEGFLGNHAGLSFLLEGNASRVVVYDFNPLD